MKTILFSLAMMMSLNAFADPSIKGTVLLNKKSYATEIEMGANAKTVTLDEITYRIDSNHIGGNITASNENGKIEVVFGEALNALKLMKRGAIVKYYGLSNGREVVCTQESNAFLTYSMDGKTIVGNCVY